jgi:hypothetical protein
VIGTWGVAAGVDVSLLFVVVLLVAAVILMQRQVS